LHSVRIPYRNFIAAKPSFVRIKNIKSNQNARWNIKMNLSSCTLRSN
jgi:hypothetical protein